MLELAFKRPRRHFNGHWPDRLTGLFELNVSFSGKSVLDAGCNMGIIAYEISKQRPASIHGIDNSRPHVTVANWVFSGVNLPSEFNCVDMSNLKRLRAKLKPSYDVVLFLSVYQHLHREHGKETADAVTAVLAGRCRETMIARTTPEMRDKMRTVLEAGGFKVQREQDNLLLLHRAKAL